MMTREELIQSRKLDRTEEKKRRLTSEQLQRDIDEFLAAGGKIKHIEPNVRAIEYLPFSVSRNIIYGDE